jgi:hypothetical protein
MSVIGPENITDADCKRGRVTHRPPISYAQYKYPKWLSEPDTVKVRFPKGDQYVCDLMHDASNAKTYLKWFQMYLRVLDNQKLHPPLDVATKERKILLEMSRSSPRLPRGNPRRTR